MKLHRISVVVACIAIAGCDGGSGVESSTESAPSRADCIAGVSFSKNEVRQTADFQRELERVIPELVRALNSEVQNDSVEVAPSMNMNWSTQTLYVQFAENCRKRYDYIEAALADVATQSIDYRVVTAPIEPGVTTIDVKGPYWRDS